jgi:hypothetical protein
MREYVEWIVGHEKLVVAITFALVIALIVQMNFCKARIEPEANLPSSQPRADQFTQPSGSTGNVAGRWEMSIQRRKGGTQTWTLTLEQNGEVIKGVINSEGGDLPVAGTIRGQSIKLSAKRFGVTVEFPATLTGDTMTGTMRAMTVTRPWTAKRM